MRTVMSDRVRVSTRYQMECWGFFHQDGQQCPEPRKCRDYHMPVLKWRETFQNRVVTAGLNILLGQTFDAVASAVLWYVGLIGAESNGTVAIDTGTDDITGTSTDFQAVDVGSDIIIVGAGVAGADLRSTIATRASTTAATTADNAGTTVAGAAYAVEPRAADIMSSKSFVDAAPYSNATRPAWTKNGAPSAGAMSNSASKAAFTINASSRIFGAFLVNENTVSGTTQTLYGGGLFTTVSRQVESGDTLNVQADLSAVAA